MHEAKIGTKIEPPRIIPSLTEGFNSIASHIYIIVFPVAFDLLLWFGPLIRIKNLLLPAILNATEASASAYAGESQSLIESSKETWTAILSQFNLLSGLRTLPIGIPSLLVGHGVTQNPLGVLSIIEIQTPYTIWWITLGLFFIGVILGCFYYSLIASVTTETGGSLKLQDLVKNAIQSFILSLLLFMALFILSIPAICLIFAIALFLPALGYVPFMIFGLIFVWVMLPLAFSPQGIFAERLKATASIANSVRLVRSLMSSAGLFFMIMILMQYGLDFLWSTPDSGNWMLLIGILGHAFISSGLIASTFVYYKKGTVWLRTALQEINAGNRKIIS